MRWPIWFYSDYDLGINLSYNRNQIDALSEKNQQLSKLKSTLQNRWNLYSYYVNNATSNHYTIGNILTYKTKATDINNVLNNDGYQYVAVVKDKLTDYNKFISKGETQLQGYFANASAVIAKIDSYISANNTDITSHETAIDTRRRTAYNALDEED